MFQELDHLLFGWRGISGFGHVYSGIRVRVMRRITKRKFLSLFIKLPGLWQNFVALWRDLFMTAGAECRVSRANYQ